MYDWLKPKAVVPMHGEARHLRDIADEAAHAASDASREAARALVEQGEFSLRDTGALLGVSHQRVGQLVKR